MPPGPGAKWSGKAFVRHGPLTYPPHLTPNGERRDQKHPPQTPGPRTEAEPAQTQKRPAHSAPPARAAHPLRRRPAPPPHPAAGAPRSRPSELGARRPIVPVRILSARRLRVAMMANAWAAVEKTQRQGPPPPHPSRGPLGSASGTTPTCAGRAGASAAEPNTTASIESGAPRPHQHRASRPRNVRHESVSCAWTTPPAMATPPTPGDHREVQASATPRGTPEVPPRPGLGHESSSVAIIASATLLPCLLVRRRPRSCSREHEGLFLSRAVVLPRGPRSMVA